MSVWTYTAVGGDGTRTQGEIEARSRREALQKLNLSRLQPLRVALRGETGAAAAKAETASAKGSAVLNRHQLVGFTKELSDLLNAGLQLEAAFFSMSRRREMSGVKAVVDRLLVSIREGETFAASLRAASPSFDELYCRLAEAGELSGALPHILKQQALHLKAMNDLRNRMVQTLIYPACLIVTIIGLICVVMIALVPQLTDFLADSDKKLPAMTQLLLTGVGFLTRWWWLLLLGAVAAVAACWTFLSRPRGRHWWDRVQLRLPVIGALISSRYYVQFSQTLATMVGNGIPLLNALQLMHAATMNRHLHDLLGTVVVVVEEGKPFTEALEKARGFPPMMIDIVAVGEQTGDMALALESVGVRYDEELALKTQRAMSLVQPVVLVVLAVSVGTVGYALVMGIFQSMSGIAQ